MLQPRRIALVVAASAAVLGVAACGGADVSKEKFTSELVKKASLTKEQASCVTDKLYADLKQDDINKLYSADKITDVSAKARESLTAAVTSCAVGSGGTTTGK